MKRRAIGIYREMEFSPGKVEADAAILDAVLAELASHGIETEAFDAKTFVASTAAAADAEIILAMCQSESALRRLAELESNGAVAVNSALAIRNCYRDLLGAGLLRARVPSPDGVLLATASPIDMRRLSALDLEAGVFVKRGDLHALAPQDVQEVRGRAELATTLADFARRGIALVYVQQAATGHTVKFYGVSGAEYFNVIAQEGEVSEEVARALAEAAGVAATALGLEAWGGDALVDGDRFAIVDFNDWPSFSRVRAPAARAIARRALKLLARPRTAAAYP
jgi:glutathione synthase/RimK-type ligase-like ATP-grasp enzyme